MLTLFRILLIPVMVFVFYAPFNGANIAASADLHRGGDHRLARRLDRAHDTDVHSAFGEFLDPVADKLMVAVTLFLHRAGKPDACRWR